MRTRRKRRRYRFTRMNSRTISEPIGQAGWRKFASPDGTGGLQRDWTRSAPYNAASTAQAREAPMYHHVKKLMYTVHVDEPDPRFGKMLLEQFGGANGELAAAMESSIQGLNCERPGLEDMW